MKKLINVDMHLRIMGKEIDMKDQDLKEKEIWIKENQ